MTKRVRRGFSPEYEEQSVVPLSEAGASFAGVAAELGITATQLKTWRLELDAAGSAVAIAAQRAETDELAQLRHDNKRRKEEVEVLSKASAFSAQWGGETVKAKLAFFAAKTGAHSIRLLCQLLVVARSWYHVWQPAAPQRAERTARRAALVEEMRAIFEANKRRYGAPRIHAEPRDRGRHLSKRTVAKLMSENGIRPPSRTRKVAITTDSQHYYAIAPNLLERTFKTAAPDAVWLAGISYNPTDEGWLYLAAVKDVATMKLVGWSMSERLKGTLCEDALKMAIRNQRPSRGLIHRTGRGVQYACSDYRKLLALHGITASMSRKGNCLDNAPMESFFEAGKPYKFIITAVAKKLVTIANALCNCRQKWALPTT